MPGRSDTSEKNSFPRTSLRLISWFCKPELVEEICGNLEEYHHNLSRNRRTFKQVKYWYEVLSYFRLSTLRKVNYSKQTTMFYFNPKITFRSLWRNKAHSFIN
ncbi:MAG: hypothetical protein KI790_21625, partial [Cyclobacteriaceae bacterium]|nr:hypothetical protein [Cyclobacteriaceae bacterium HetDA_MAG_MS6]